MLEKLLFRHTLPQSLALRAGLALGLGKAWVHRASRLSTGEDVIDVIVNSTDVL